MELITKMTLSNNQRMCVITRVRKPKTSLIKITRIDNKWLIDKDYQLFGRSIYLDLNAQVLDKFKKQNRRFRIEKNNFDQIIKQLEEMI